MLSGTTFQNGYTALMRAAGNGYCDACILLIDEGANVNATKPVRLVLSWLSQVSQSRIARSDSQRKLD